MAPDSDQTAWPRDTQRPVGAADVPDRLRPLLGDIETATAARDGEAMLEALRRLIAAIGDDEPRWLGAAAQQELGEVLAQVRPGDGDASLEEMIRAFEAALEVYSAEVCSVEYATIQNNLGNAYRIRRRGSPEHNVERAIAAYRAALTVRERDTDPYGWARTQNNLGNAYAERRRGEQADNQRLAIAAFQAALEVHDVVDYPYDYAMDQTNLGLTLREYAGGTRAANLDLAMVCFLRALLVRTPWGDPQRHRRLVISLSDAFRDRIELTPPAARGDVITALRPVLGTLVEAQTYLRIPVGLPDPPPAGPTAGYDPAWLPDPVLFSAYKRDRYRVMPLFDLLTLINSVVAEGDHAGSIELLRAALSRSDLVLPSLRAELLDQLALALLEVDTGDRAQRQEEAIAALQTALTGITAEENPQDWGVINQHLASAFGDRIAGDRAENLDRAIGHATAFAVTQTAGSSNWALAMNLLGQLYRDRRFGDSADNVRRAIEAFEDALRVWTQPAEPYLWARVNNSLGLTYLYRGGNRAAMLDAAIEAFDNALTVLTREEHPYDRAGTEFNLATAWGRRRSGDRADNIERAIAGYRECLSVRTRQRYPVDWARTQHNLAQMYRQRQRGDRTDNLRMAAGCLRAALEVLTLTDLPADHRSTVGSLGEVEADRGDWQAAHEAFAAVAMAEEILVSAVGTGVHGFDEVARGSHEVGELDAYALAQLGRLEEAVEAVERGRARSLADALAVRRADPVRITDPDRRRRYVMARDALVAAQSSVNEVRWRHQPEAESPGTATAGPAAEVFGLTAAARTAREGFEAVVAEIRREGDPADFLEGSPTADQIAAGTDRAVVYLIATQWGGLALAVPPSQPGPNGPATLRSCPLPALTDDLVGGLIQVSLDGGYGEIVGGYGAAQEGTGLNWIVGQWPGETFAEKADRMHAACVDAQVDGALDAAAQELLRADHPGLPEVMRTPVRDLTDADLSRLAATLNHAFLRAELRRCLPVLAEAAMRPLTEWLLDQGLTTLALVACRSLPAFPLLAAPLYGPPGHDATTSGSGTPAPASGSRDIGQLASDSVQAARPTTVADRLVATVAPSARSLLGATGHGRPRSGVWTLGDPRPTHQDLRWGEAEALAVAALAGAPDRARVREAATRDWLMTGLRNGELVTASCHGQFDGRDFLQSRLLLANGEALTLRAALSNEVEMDGLPLLVLSACQTAVMDIRGASGEVRSLAVGMLQAGARAVMGSLWAVDDRATFLLMVRFAREWLAVADNENPATALARAQSWLRTARQQDLAAWEIEARIAPGSGTPDTTPDRADLASVRGRGERYTIAEAGQLITGIARRAATGSPDEVPYADPIFWAGFQVHGRSPHVNFNTAQQMPRSPRRHGGGPGKP